MKRAAKLDLAGVGPDGLRLQVEEDQARTGAIGNANRNRFAAGSRPEARLHDESHPVGGDLPRRIVGQVAGGAERPGPSR